MSRIDSLNKYIKYWQIRLSLQGWKINVELKSFNRKDYPQSGDIKIDLENKKATIFISEEETGIDKKIILHELIHLILWDLDVYSEQWIPENNKGDYFGRLESTVERITNTILHQDE